MGKINSTRLEVSSDQLHGELVEIKERLSALETVAGLQNQPAIEKLLRECLKSDKRMEVFKECRTPVSREKLIERLNLNSAQSLDYHLNPLRDEGVIHVRNTNGTQTFEWSNLVRQLPKARIEGILNGK